MHIDTAAINTIADILNENEEWSSDELDDIAAVLDAVRPKVDGGWPVTGPTLTWRDRKYVFTAMGPFRPTFTTPFDQHADREGQPFEVVAVFTEANDEMDAEVLPMYRIQFADGTEIHAWPEEVLADA